MSTVEEERDEYDELEGGVHRYELEHRARDQVLRATVRLSEQQRLCGQLGCERERGHRVHYQVHPEHLDRFQRRLLFTC